MKGRGKGGLSRTRASASAAQRTSIGGRVDTRNKKEGTPTSKKRWRAPKKRTRLGVRHASKYLDRRKRRAAAGQVTADAATDHPQKQEHRETAFQAGYDLGHYEGGEQLLEHSVPHHLLLPEVSLREVIAAGIDVLSPRMLPLIGVHEVFAEMEQAIQAEQPCAVVRLGDGELLALSQEVVYDGPTVLHEGKFLPYAGVTPPDLMARDQLALAVQHAQIVGVPLSRRKHFQPLLHPVLRGHGIHPGSLRMTTSTINYGLYQEGLLLRLLAGRKLLLIGNAAPPLAVLLQERGYTVSGIISPVNGFPDIERVMSEVRDAVFDLALVSAGIPAVVICWRIAAERGKVALDFGHMADTIVKGQVVL
ncbi:succinyl-CoA synthetase [Paenibacillus oenotherae]|uniref:Succinyl-CoA synthetase n=1 Tax=Paenibacillus oenotherae TaxID=1435645 RepID=A0ABS7D4U8_9BACL|nr:GT-D fold domain-containing glycosyltransferase [Paenibacillus oenotherae]MBW7474516.1 succinyl-CoA synthetase [Paenibacillus oenotherae]